jgi:hypothetical protein
MTNRNMVKSGADAGRAMPEPNPTRPQPLPAPESSPDPVTLKEPLDSPQLKPMINQHRTKGLKAPG